jgi:hypothetical protein
VREKETDVDNAEQDKSHARGDTLEAPWLNRKQDKDREDCQHEENQQAVYPAEMGGQGERETKGHGNDSLLGSDVRKGEPIELDESPARSSEDKDEKTDRLREIDNQENEWSGHKGCQYSLENRFDLDCILACKTIDRYPGLQISCSLVRPNRLSLDW